MQDPIYKQTSGFEKAKTNQDEHLPNRNIEKQVWRNARNWKIFVSPNPQHDAHTVLIELVVSQCLGPAVCGMSASVGDGKHRTIYNIVEFLWISISV